MSIGEWSPPAGGADSAGAPTTASLQGAVDRVAHVMDGCQPEDWDGRSVPEASLLTIADAAQLSAADMKSGADPGWALRAESLDADALVKLVQLVVLLESRCVGFEAGADSPAVPLAAALRARQAWPTWLTPWIRRHSDNRFLPYGSLLSRL